MSVSYYYNGYPMVRKYQRRIWQGEGEIIHLMGNTLILEFFQVIKGMEVVHKIEQLRTDIYDKILKSVMISNSGLLQMTEPFYEDSRNYEYVQFSIFEYIHSVF